MVRPAGSRATAAFRVMSTGRSCSETARSWFAAPLAWSTQLPRWSLTTWRSTAISRHRASSRLSAGQPRATQAERPGLHAMYRPEPRPSPPRRLRAPQLPIRSANVPNSDPCAPAIMLVMMEHRSGPRRCNGRLRHARTSRSSLGTAPPRRRRCAGPTLLVPGGAACRTWQPSSSG